MSAQRRFKGNYLYQTNAMDTVFTSVPLEPKETPGPGTYVTIDAQSISNLTNRKESMSKTGYGVGFASKQQRFTTSSLNMLKSPNSQLELIYARASSSPGPGHYSPGISGAEIGANVIERITKKKKWIVPAQKKPFDFRKNTGHQSQGSVNDTADEKTISSMAVTAGGATYDLD